MPGPKPRGQTRPGRASAGARGCECAMRARPASVCVPAFPFLPRRSSGQIEQRAAPKGQQLCVRAQPRRGESGDRGRGAAAPPGLGRGSPRSAHRSRREARREQAARRLPRLREAAGPARRPPRLFPFLSTPSLHPRTPCREARPVCSSGHGGSVSRSRTGSRRRSVGTRRPVPLPRAQDAEPGEEAPRIDRLLQGWPRASRWFSECGSPAKQDWGWNKATHFRAIESCWTLLVAKPALKHRRPPSPGKDRLGF